MTDLPVFTRGTGIRAGIDPSSNRAFYDALDASEFRRYDGVEVIAPDE